ncbi:hypothetical protein C2S41_07770 [Helicobacter pylori]|nr:hypothetical protein C2S41_07770 [Helicobacter pylori]
MLFVGGVFLVGVVDVGLCFFYVCFLFFIFVLKFVVLNMHGLNYSVKAFFFFCHFLKNFVIFLIFSAFCVVLAHKKAFSIF